jgi:CP family cyanate transporter-like MFS transporter
MAAALLLVALNMRASILAVPPVLGEIQRALDLSPTLQGLLVSLPVVCFGVCAFAGPRITRWLGIEATLAWAMMLLTAGTLLRLYVVTVALFVGTVIIGTAVGLSNVVIPALIKRDFPDHIGLMTGLYITVMTGTAALAAGATVPFMNATGVAWQWALSVWAIPAFMAALVWGGLAVHKRDVARADIPTESVGGLWRDGVAWSVTLFMGLQSLSFFAVSGWLPTLLSDSGAKLTTGGVLLALTSAIGIPASLGIAMLAARQRRQNSSVFFAIGISTLGLLGFVVSPGSGALLWTLLFGIGQGASLGLALTFIGLRSSDSHHATQLSGMAQSFGYLVAAVGPLFLGVIHAAVGNWTLPMALVSAMMLPQLLAGLGAARPRYVETRAENRDRIRA